MPVVMPQDIGENTITTVQIARVPPTVAARLERHRLATGDIVFSRRGDVTRRALVREDSAEWLCGTGCLRVRPGSAVDSQFLSYLLGTADARDWLLGNAVGTNMLNLNTTILGRLPLNVPPRPEQQAIAEVLGALDDKIAANTALAGTAEQLLRAEIDAAWLHNGNRDAMLSDYVIMNPKTTMPRVDNAIYIDMKRLPEAGWSIDGYDYREPKGGARFQNGDTLLARITPCLENRKTGFVDHLPNGEIGIGSTEFIVMRSRGDVAAPISFLLATEARFRDFAVQHMVGTSGRQRVGAADIATFTLPRPNPMWLAGFGRRAEAVFSAVAAHVAENRTLAATRDALLPQLMSGKLRVRAAETLASAVI
ncbi:restriction endonuclease subunit S [Microbacterium sp.]|uniref:restriction endonuclease subunit S n=1 Tax=Microbacterium sp. TaxID=51671 RepID=UPI0025801C94|nr:restriction endonuclease subunit S [Microbacterium sp.]